MSKGIRIHWDRTGFPMLWCKDIGAYVHWLPVSKIQFEYFLCDAPDAHFDAEWYDHVLRLNPRITPRDVSGTNYWRALITALLPAEAQRFAFWCGDGYRLPTESEWTAIYWSYRGEAAENLSSSGLLAKLDGRARMLLERIDVSVDEARRRMGYGPDLASQMLLRFGAMEWVRAGSPPSAWRTMGEPLPEFCGNLATLDRPAETFALDPEASRLPAAGFRLLFSPPRTKAESEEDEQAPAK